MKDNHLTKTVPDIDIFCTTLFIVSSVLYDI